MEPILVKQDIPSKFNIIIDSIRLELSLLITINLHSQDMYKIELVVPLPDAYPNTDFREKGNINDVAKLSIDYYVIEKNMFIDLFFVYDKMEPYKKFIKGNEQFNTKGLGKYMLCTVVQYLLENTDWFDINSIVTLKAWGGECNPKYEKTYTLTEQYIKDLRQSNLLFDFLTNYLDEKDILLKRLNKLHLHLQLEELEEYYEENKEEVNALIEDIINKSKTITLGLLKRYLCEVRTNDDLITKNYSKIYGFRVVKNYGVYSYLIGNVYSLLSACVSSRDLAMYKAKHASKSSRVDIKALLSEKEILNNLLSLHVPDKNKIVERMTQIDQYLFNYLDIFNDSKKANKMEPIGGMAGFGKKRKSKKRKALLGKISY